jgi:hypothetical protein
MSRSTNPGIVQRNVSFYQSWHPSMQYVALQILVLFKEMCRSTNPGILQRNMLLYQSWYPTKMSRSTNPGILQTNGELGVKC